MEEKKKKNIVVLVGIAIAFVLVIGLIYFNSSSNKSDKMTNEAKQLELFTKSLSAEFDSYGDVSGLSFEELQSKMAGSVVKTQKSFGSSQSSSVMAYGQDLLNKINGATAGTDLMGMLEGLLGDLDPMALVTGLLGGGSTESTATHTTVTLGSTTACKAVADSKYCLDGKSKALSAEVYVVDANSTKWAVLLHGVLMSGSLMHSSVGTMYEAQGYNVLAIDSRGHGNSDGSVAMGYLESLDVYDWIKDLNANPTRYGVKAAPSSIIVHGVSLGGATTLQLATNPDIAAKKGEPYTKSLTDLHVTGFVDDCGYTSMSGIITGMLSIGDTSSLTSMLESLGIGNIDFMGELKKLLGGLNIKGFENFDTSSFAGMEGLTDKFSEFYEALTNAGNSSNISSSLESTLESFLGNANISDIMNKYGNIFGNSGVTMPGWGSMPNMGTIIPGTGNANPQTGTTTPSTGTQNQGSGTTNWGSNWGSNWGTGTTTPSTGTTNQGSGTTNWGSNWGSNWGTGSGTTNWGSNWGNGTTTDNSQITDCLKDWRSCMKPTSSSTNSSKVTFVNNTSGASNENFLDGLVGTALMNLVGVGLTEENYDYYSDSFASGRNFPAGSKVLVIHGTADTTVPYSNATTVANKAGDKLFFNWKVEGQPHAFIVIGSEKDKYSKLVTNFTKCVEGGECKTADPFK